MAAAESIISNKIYTNIFQQYYLPAKEAAREAIDDVLDRLYMNNHRLEAIFRLQLLFAHEHDEETYMTGILQSIVGEVVGLLDPLLFAPNSREEFQSELWKLLQDAVKIWKHVQRSPERVLVENEPDQDWGVYEDHDTSVGLPAEQTAHILDEQAAITPLFPRVSIENFIISEGYALWANQNTVIAANFEYSQLNSRSPAHGRTNSDTRGSIRRGGDRRRLSLAGSLAGDRRFEDASTSPRTLSGYQSFLNHAEGRKMSFPGGHDGARGD